MSDGVVGIGCMHAVCGDFRQQGVHRLYTRCIHRLYIHKVHTGCTQGAHRLYTVCTQVTGARECPLVIVR